MNPAITKILEAYLKPTPVAEPMTARDIVRAAIEFNSPVRIPFSFITPFESDFFETAVFKGFFYDSQTRPSKTKGEIYYDEWNVGQKVTGRTWDHAFDHPLSDLNNLKDYSLPPMADPDRFGSFIPVINQAKKAGKYVVGFDPIMMFERMRSLMGFEELMVAPYVQPDGLEELLDRLVDMTIEVMDRWVDVSDVDGFMTWEDWGLQTSLQMSLEIFRKYYKPRYARLVEAAHERGFHYIWHNCGWIMEMIPEMVDIGVDVIQLDQPRLMGSDNLARRFGDRICFWNTVDIQWSAGEGVEIDDIKAEVKSMVQTSGWKKGGFMARQYPQPRDINLGPEIGLAIYEAFMENGCRLDQDVD